MLALAAGAGARVAVLPCCHRLDSADTAALDGWVDEALAVDIVRAMRLRDRGYRTWTQTIPAAITPKNRLLLGQPARVVRTTTQYTASGARRQERQARGG